MTERLFQAAILAGSLSVDAACASDVPFDDRIQLVRGYYAQRKVAELFRKLLAKSKIREAHRFCNRVQDPYSLRCQPQVMGAILYHLEFIKKTLGIEINSITDNPLVFIHEREILSGGNFHGEMLAITADNLALALAEIGSLAERRIALLMDHHFTGLPYYLVKEGGLNSGFMVAHVTAAACASENKALAHPHSVDSLPTSANQEDHVSMSTNAAWRLNDMIENTSTIIAIELLAACQALEFHRPLVSSEKLEAAYKLVRECSPSYTQDRSLSPDIGKIKEEIKNGTFTIDTANL